MKRIAVLGILMVLAASAAQAQVRSGDISAGIILGEPTGLTAKWWTSGTQAYDLAIAWSTGRNDRFHIHGDYLIHRPDIIAVDQGKLPLYYGVGARVGIANQSDLGVRIPLGIAYHFDTHPVEVFFEIVPVFNLIPGTSFDANGGFGVRYSFGKKR
jgi:hypothetical protein